MPELVELFARQARWQRSRAALSWEEKLALAIVLREAALALRTSPQDRARGTLPLPAPRTNHR
jgi:hypothetical protein